MSLPASSSRHAASQLLGPGPSTRTSRWP